MLYRIDVANFTSLKTMAEKVQAGTHVLLDDRDNFKVIYYGVLTTVWVRGTKDLCPAHKLFW